MSFAMWPYGASELLPYYRVFMRTSESPSNLLNILLSIITNEMRYTMLCMLEWMRKEKHRIGTLKTRGLHGSTLSAYIHGGIP